MKELKRKRGRPKKGSTKNRDIHIRVTDSFYNELKELCDMDGKSMVDYITESIRNQGNLTRYRHANSEENADWSMYEDDFDENFDE